MCATQRTTGACAQCYERAVKTWIALGVLAVTGAIIAVVMLTRDHGPARPAEDAVVADFRSVERQCITAFNNALRQQRANEIDEVELAVTIERDVLEPWRAMRARVTAAPVPPERRELYDVMHRYIGERQQAWQAYADALRAPSDAESRPLYDAYHDRNAAAQDDARVLGGLLRQHN
jgi:hypothetical protein